MAGNQDPESRTGALARLERFVAWGKLAGISPPVVERFVDFWKAFGLVKALAILIAVFLPILKFVWLPHAASVTAATIAEGYGVDLQVGTWTADLLDLDVRAHDVLVKSTGQYARQEILRADAIAVDLSLVRKLRRGQWIDSVTVLEPNVYVERLLSGRWNVEDVIGRPEAVEDEAGETLVYANLLASLVNPAEWVVRGAMERLFPADEPGFEIPRLHLEKLRIEWVENLPGGSGGGLIHSSKASFFVDDVRILVQDVRGPVDARSEPSRFSLEGRSADGKVSMSGTANLFNWSTGAPASAGPGIQVVSTTAEDLGWSPRLTARIYLENIGTAAVGQMVPAFLVPVAGSMTGWIDVGLRDGRFDCKCELAFTNIAYALNPQLLATVPRPAALERDLENFRANGKIVEPCQLAGADTTSQHPLHVVQAAMTREAVKGAPPTVRRVAAIDDQRLTGKEAASEAYDAVTRELSRQLIGKAAAGFLGDQGGDAFARSLTGTDVPAGQPGATQPSGVNPVSKGIKGIGSGIKRLFGGGSSDKKGR
jgi:hypothetical protein